MLWERIPNIGALKMNTEKMANKNKKQVVVAVSGGFDPVHIGHILLFQAARKLGDKLVVILNNDNWLKKKKGRIFMRQDERKGIIEAVKGVDEVILTGHGPNPEDMSVSRELMEIKPDIFANGGDRVFANIPEVPVCKSIGCEMVFNVGQGGKMQSSSWLLAEYSKGKAKEEIDIEKTLKKIENAMLKSNPVRGRTSLNGSSADHARGAGQTSNGMPFLLKKRLSRLILNLMNRRDGFGLFIILGWESRWNNLTDMPDNKQDIYGKHGVNLNVMEIGKPNIHYDIETTISFDGAILVDRNGNILHSGVMIEGLKPKEIAKKVNPGEFKDLSEQFGFKTKVHLRHLSAISVSYVFKNTTVFTVSEETGAFHIFEDGKIIYSTK